MKVIDRYLLRESLLPLGFGLCLFLAALVMDRLFDLLDLVFNRGVSPFTVGYLLLCLLPSIVAITLPMAILLSSLMAFGRLASDRELLAFKGAGVSLTRMAAPLVALGLSMSAVLLAFNGTVLPGANAAYKRIFLDIVKKRATVAFRERVFIREYKDYLLYFNRKEGKEGVLKDLCIIELARRPPRIVTARTGEIKVDQESMRVKLALGDGMVDQPLDKDGSQYTRVRFASYELGLDVGSALGGGRILAKGISEMNYADLWKMMKDKRKRPAERRPFSVEMHQRVALAFAPLFVVLVGVPLGALARRGGGVGVVLSLGLTFCYYILLTLAQGFAEGGKFPIWAALWTPNLFMGLAGAAAFWVAMREASWMRWGR